jgi:hypothetical protein
VTNHSSDFRIFEATAAFEYPFSLIRRIWHELRTPYEPDERLEQLTPGQRAQYALRWIEVEVENGGFQQCFSNTTGYLMPEGVYGAHLFGSDQWAAVLSAAADVLGSSYPRDHAERAHLLSMLDETEMGELRNCDERLYELNLNPETSLRTLIDRYVAAHPNDFYVEPVDEAEAAKALLANAREIVNGCGSSGGTLADAATWRFAAPHRMFRPPEVHRRDRYALDSAIRRRFGVRCGDQCYGQHQTRWSARRGRPSRRAAPDRNCRLGRDRCSTESRAHAATMHN